MNDNDFDDTPAPPSKSQRKRESTAAQAMGAMLVTLPPEHVRKLELPDLLEAAILEAQCMNSHGARRRQLQYIGRLMRDVELETIVERVAILRGESDRTKVRLHALEHWRERLLAQDQALTDWMERHPETDVQQLRHWIRKARKEAAEGKRAHAQRALFRMLAAQSHTDDTDRADTDRTDTDPDNTDSNNTDGGYLDRGDSASGSEGMGGATH